MEKDASSCYVWHSATQTLKLYGLSALLSVGILFIISLFVNNALLYYVGGILFLVPILAPLTVKWRPKERICPEGKAVLITGCDRGFGYMLAQRLDDLGFQVFAGCLFPSDDGASNLLKSGSDRLHVIGLDVTSDTSVLDAVAYVKENLQDNVLWAVVNNAGIVSGGEIDLTSTETVQKVIEVNTLGVVRVTKAFLSKLKESKGKVITVASLAGRVTIPAIVSYCMSKAATISFCDGLRLEMYQWGIRVITIEPSFYRTALVKEFSKTSLQTWQNVPREVKDMYGPDYVKVVTNRVQPLANYFCRDPSEVVSVMEDALMALCSEYSYSPGSLTTKVLAWIVQKLPKPITDTVIFCIMRYILR